MTWWQAKVEVSSSIAETLAWLITDELDIPAEVQDTTTLIRSGKFGRAAVLLAFGEEPPSDLQVNVSEMLARLSQPNAEVSIRKSEDDSWRDSWRDFFKGGPISKNLCVVPSDRPIPEDLRGLKPILIEPGMAFGTGEHVTTRLAMSTLDDLLCSLSESVKILDVGSGSAILCIGAALLGHTALGVEIDHDAQENAHNNVRYNHVEDKVELKEGAIENEGTFAVVVANMLAREICENAEVIASCADDHLILSGLLESQRDAVLRAFPDFSLCDQRGEGDWRSLHMRRKIAIC